MTKCKCNEIVMDKLPLPCYDCLIEKRGPTEEILQAKERARLRVKYAVKSYWREKKREKNIALMRKAINHNLQNRGATK